MPDINAPWSPEEATTVPADKQQELRNTQASLPIIDNVLTWFDEQIALYRDPETIEGVNVSSDPQQVKDAILLAQGFIKGYKSKRNEFVKRFEEYIQVVNPE